MPLEEPSEEGGRELYGDANGFGLGAGDMLSSKGFARWISGVPTRNGLGARVVVVVVPPPLK
jgi:hypothetical protein